MHYKKRSIQFPPLLGSAHGLVTAGAELFVAEHVTAPTVEELLTAHEAPIESLKRITNQRLVAIDRTGRRTPRMERLLPKMAD